MFKYKNTYLLFLSLILSISCFSQSNNTVNVDKVAPTNYLEMLMVTVAALLVVVIWVLANVLGMVSKKAVEIAKSGNKVMMIAFVVLGSMFANQSFAQTALASNSVADTTLKQAQADYYGGLTSTTFWTLSTVLALELLVIILLVLFIRGLWKVIYPSPVILKNQHEKSSSWGVRTWHYLDKQFFTKAIPIEQEADKLLDHDYDGIKELDNALPPWWKYGFIITIFIAVIYLFKYEIFHNGPNPTEEYITEMNTAKEQVDNYLASMKNNVDEKSVTMLDAAGIASGKATFLKTCVACHGAKGEGGVGPNLTDDYWLHGGKISDVFKTIKYGYPDKGMQSWQSTYSPIQIQELASYVKSLKGSNPPNGKAPQGDFFKEMPVEKDSVKSANYKDSVGVAK